MEITNIREYKIKDNIYILNNTIRSVFDKEQIIEYCEKYRQIYLDLKHKKKLSYKYPETFTFIDDTRNFIEIVMKCKVD